jgi:hypothetical protein
MASVVILSRYILVSFIRVRAGAGSDQP